MDISAVVIVIIIIVECYDNRHCSSSSQIRDVHTDGIFAADIGAAAYAESVQDCSFSTQEVIDSMLEHDKCFQGLLVEASTDFEIDIWELRFAVVDAYRHFKEYEEIMISKGGQPRHLEMLLSGHLGVLEGLQDWKIPEASIWSFQVHGTQKRMLHCSCCTPIGEFLSGMKCTVGKVTSSRQFVFLVRPNVHDSFDVCTKRIQQTAVAPVES